MADFQIERLKQLPQRAGDTWQGGFVRMPGWITEGCDKPFRALTAIGSYQELLRLNPGDNQGVRYMLLPLLLARGQFEPAEKLMADFGDDAMATWRYCRAC